MLNKRALFFALTTLISFESSSAQNKSPLSSVKTSDEPTTITSDSLQLNSEKRVFTYSGNVKVVRGDMTLTSKFIDGSYTVDSKLNELIAREDVFITKGPSIKARSNRAVYDAKRELITLTENPEILQDGSALTADVVKIFLQENKSVAEGQVKVKLDQSQKAPVSGSAVK